LKSNRFEADEDQHGEVVEAWGGGGLRWWGGSACTS
jgi:hypothetical protein